MRSIFTCQHHWCAPSNGRVRLYRSLFYLPKKSDRKKKIASIVRVVTHSHLNWKILSGNGTFYTLRIGRRWVTRSMVLPWCPALLIVWWPTTIFHFAEEFFSVISRSYIMYICPKRTIMKILIILFVWHW